MVVIVRVDVDTAAVVVVVVDDGGCGPSVRWEAGIVPQRPVVVVVVVAVDMMARSNGFGFCGVHSFK